MQPSQNSIPPTTHSTKRRKYSPGELSTQCVQCNRVICDQIKKTPVCVQAIEIQCDIGASENVEDSPICSECRCTPGFCSDRCQSANKLALRKSDTSLRKENDSGLDKRCSAPGLNRGSSPVVSQKSKCKCTGKCTNACRKTKMASAVAALKESKTKANARKSCESQKCAAGCNPCNADNPTAASASICVGCQCSGVCPVKCLIKKIGIKYLINSEELRTPAGGGICTPSTCTNECKPKDSQSKSMAKVCEKCDCPGVCTEACKQNKSIAKVCEKCDCPGVCTDACKQKMEESKKPCNCRKCLEENYEIANDNKKAIVCMPCACVGACNQPCELNKDTPKSPNMDQGPLICDPCACPNLCSNECQAAKEAANTICEECICNATCTPACEANMKSKANPSQTCDDCKCCGTCNGENETNIVSTRKESKKEVRISTVETEPEPSPETDESESTPRMTGEEDSHTQVNGIIENFNDENITDNITDSPILEDEKNRSSCNVPGEIICEDCICSDECNRKCMAVRKIKSISEFPPKNTVCEVCRCAYSCSKACELAKAGKVADLPELNNDNGTCVTPFGKTVKCDEEDPDWVPCFNCKDKEPCSPECRERRAIAYTLPQPPGISCGMLETKEEVSCAKPKRVSCVKPVQTCSIARSCGEVQAAFDEENLTRGTSTPNANICERSCGSTRDTKSCGSAMESKSCADAIQSTSCGDPRPSTQKSCGQSHQQEPPCMPPPCEPQAEPECNMCHKICSLVGSLFRKDNNNQVCGQQDPQTTTPTCASPMHNNDRCQCNNLHPTNSYADKMKMVLGQLRATCDDAEAFASPFIKAASVFDLDVHNQQEAIVALLHKCQQKDNYIDALIEDLLRRSQSKAFNGVLQRLQEPCSMAPDFDTALIAKVLNRNQQCKTVCGIDLHNFKITSMKRVGPTNLLTQWTPPDDTRVEGYEIVVNGMLKMSITQKERVYAVLDALNLSTTISIEIYAIALGGRAYPSAIGYYAKY